MMLDENIGLLISYFVFVMINYQSLQLDFGIINLSPRKLRNSSLNLKMENIQTYHPGCQHVFNPSFLKNLMMYRCFEGEQTINEGIYHNHRIQFNINKDKEVPAVLSKIEELKSIDMSYQAPIEAIEKRRGTGAGWSWIGVEDARFFVNKGVEYVVFTAPSSKVQVQVMRGMFIMKLDDALTGVYSAKEIDNKIGFKRKTEKHWAFIGNKDGTINVIYQLEPFTLGYLDANYVLIPSFMQDFACLESKGDSSINIATNVILVHHKSDFLFLIYHAKDGSYNPHFLVLEPSYPYAPIMISSKPLKISTTKNENFVYISSLSTERGTLEANIDDIIVVGAGTSDRGTAFAKLTVKDLFGIGYTMCNDV
eukprot:NODE_423_length_8874_cov_0.432023.p2 type:complete len:366 gc:universal NODE_423_length_8874_cov_0.432023:1756-2853(+)